MKLALLLVLVASCCHEKPAPVCPTLPARDVSPPVVTVAAPRVPCLRPDKPTAPQLVGAPTADGHGAVLTTETLAALVVYLAADKLRDDASDACLEGL